VGGADKKVAVSLVRRHNVRKPVAEVFAEFHFTIFK